MKRILPSCLLLLLIPFLMNGQPVKGIIYADTAGIMVVKVWGTHTERGYALGYLTGDRITDVIQNYLKPQFGPFYTSARNIILAGNDLTIPSEYVDEATAIINGMNAAGTNTGNLDWTDVIVGNTFLDLSNLLSKKMGMNCSVLMSWNDATVGTDLNGKSVATRHLDWEYSQVLNRNNIIVVHFPTEPGQSKWLLVGFSGMISVLSGFNPDFSAFQNMMDDFTGAAQHDKHYMPIWFALRRALEASDYNNDGKRDVQDVRSSLADFPIGYADGYIVSSLARSAPVDSLVAMVAEITPATPTLTFRSSSYPDSIPGDNLYTANYQIARNNMMHFCTRYNGIRSNIGDGTLIGTDTSWNLMKTWSHLPTNTQFMEYAPEMNFFRMSIYRNGKPAYQNTPVYFSLLDLFGDPTTGISEPEQAVRVAVSPNPATDILRISTNLTSDARVDILDESGRVVMGADYHYLAPGLSLVLNIPRGFYIVRVSGKQGVGYARIVKM